MIGIQRSAEYKMGLEGMSNTYDIKLVGRQCERRDYSRATKIQDEQRAYARTNGQTV